MRRFIFILMIALLPLRGWMGEAMATEMAAMNLAASHATNIDITADSSSKMEMADCDMHKVKTTGQTAAKTTCTHCQACHATGLVNTLQIASFDKVQYEQPLVLASQFASANIAHSQKPPTL